MATSIPGTPKALEAEQALLGSLIMESTSWDKISDRLLPSDFFDIKKESFWDSFLFFKTYQQFSPSPIGMHVLEFLASSANC